MWMFPFAEHKSSPYSGELMLDMHIVALQRFTFAPFCDS